MKKLLCCILSLCCLFACLLPAQAYIAGDTDNDFEVTAADARYALRLSVKLETCDPESDQFKAADADGNGTVTSSDARTILRVAVHLESFPDNTSPYGNITATKMPYKTNGLTINSLTFDNNGDIILDISNTTGKTDLAVSSSSYIPYKIYNAAGHVIYSGTVGVNQMNNGEHCTEKIYRRDGMTRLIFGAATVKYTEAAVVTETTVIDGITVSKPPFTVSGLRVDSITLDTASRKIYMAASNQSAQPLSGTVYFLCYDAGGVSKGTISIPARATNPGEKCRDYTYYPSGTTKIIFSKANIYKEDAFTPLSGTFDTVNGIKVTKTPVTANGITLTVKEITDKKVMTVLMKNGTGDAISDSTSVRYIEYDKDGYVLAARTMYSAELNAGEACLKEVYLENDTAKVQFGNLTAVKGTPVSVGATAVVDGFTVNAMPLNFDGLKISDFKLLNKNSYGATVSVKITNNTGKPLTSSSWFKMKVLSADNTVLRTKEVYPNVDLNNGEFCYEEISLDPEAAKIYFFPGKLREGTVFPASGSYATVSGIKVTAAPFANNGLTVTSYNVDGDYLILMIRNDTGKIVTDSSYLYYKIVSTGGAVLRTSYAYCKAMNAGETCEVKLLIPEGTATITFGSFTVKTR